VITKEAFCVRSAPSISKQAGFLQGTAVKDIMMGAAHRYACRAMKRKLRRYVLVHGHKKSIKEKRKKKKAELSSY